jgi:hypothetical protein
LGHGAHPAITCFALKICCHFYREEVAKLSENRAWKRQQRLLEGSWTLIAKLEEYYAIHELKLLAY